LFDLLKAFDAAGRISGRLSAELPRDGWVSNGAEQERRCYEKSLSHGSSADAVRCRFVFNRRISGDNVRAHHL